jgi:hypothetical protein
LNGKAEKELAVAAGGSWIGDSNHRSRAIWLLWDFQRDGALSKTPKRSPKKGFVTLIDPVSILL